MPKLQRLQATRDGYLSHYKRSLNSIGRTHHVTPEELNSILDHIERLDGMIDKECTIELMKSIYITPEECISEPEGMTDEETEKWIYKMS